MAFSRNSVIAAVAGSVSLAMLTGCPQAPNPVGPGTGATASPGTGATASPGTGATTSPDPATSPTASPGTGATSSPSAPAATPSQAMLGNTTVRGTVFDESGARVSTANVRIRSLNPSNPFDTTVTVAAGSYVANEVPAGVAVEITVSREGWTSRSRVETLVPLGQGGGERNIVNFGGPTADVVDPEGPAYFISDYPEISSVEPADAATNVDPSKVSVRLTLSEALDATNQRRFAEAIRVFPVLNAASASGQATGLLEAAQAATAATAFTPTAGAAAGVAYSISRSSTFLGEEATQATVTWDSTGTVATLTFNAPLLADDDRNLRYAIALVDNGEEVQDRTGKQLGTDETGVLNTDPGTNELVYFAFREPNLALPTGTSAPGDANSRWRLTHENFSWFEVAEDDTEPTLTGVSVSKLTDRTRISFTFSEPMAAYGGSGTALYGGVSNTDADNDPATNPPTAVNSLTFGTATAGSTAALADAILRNFTFAVAETAADLENVDLDGETSTTFATNTTIGDVSGERRTEFYLDAAGGGVSLLVNPSDARVLRLDVFNPTLFATNVSAIKARVENLQDPAGNSISDSSANRNQKIGNI